VRVHITGELVCRRSAAYVKSGKDGFGERPTVNGNEDCRRIGVISYDSTFSFHNNAYPNRV